MGFEWDSMIDDGDFHGDFVAYFHGDSMVFSGCFHGILW